MKKFFALLALSLSIAYADCAPLEPKTNPVDPELAFVLPQETECLSCTPISTFEYSCQVTDESPLDFILTPVYQLGKTSESWKRNLKTWNPLIFDYGFGLNLNRISLKPDSQIFIHGFWGYSITHLSQETS
jgi:hypothetical protein